MKKVLPFLMIYFLCILGFAQKFVVDTTFNLGDTIAYPGNPFATISLMTPASNAGAYVYANKNLINGKSNIYRIKSDGSLDETFDAGTGPLLYDDYIYSYLWNPINAILANSDNSVFVGGEFQSFNGKNKPALVKLTSSGSVDISFNKNQTGLYSDYSAKVYSLCKDGDNLLVAGIFTSYNDTTVLDFIRLKPNGSLDLDFANNTRQSLPYAKMISSICRLANGKILLACYGYSDYNPFLIRLNSDGTLDNTFSFSETTFERGYIKTILELPDGRCLVGGKFAKRQNDYNSLSLFCVNTSGNITTDLMSGAGVKGFQIPYNTNYGWNEVSSTLRKSDGKIIVSGRFIGYDNYLCDNVLMFNSDLTLNQTLFSKLETVYASIIDSNGDVILAKHANYDSYQSHFVANDALCKLNLDGTINPDYNKVSGSSKPIYDLKKIGDYFYGIGYLHSYNNTVVKGGVVKLDNNGLPVANYPSAPNDFRGYTTKIVPCGATKKFVIQGEYYTHTQDKINLCLMNEQGLEQVLLSSSDLLNGTLSDFCIQKNGKIIIVGSFTRVKGIDASYIARLNQDGSVDQTFNLDISPNGTISKIDAFGTDELLIIGSFTKIDNITKNKIAKLSSEGALVNSFNLSIETNGKIYTLIDTVRNNFYIHGYLSSINNNNNTKYLAKFSEAGVLLNGFDISSLLNKSDRNMIAYDYLNDNLSIFQVDNTVLSYLTLRHFTVSPSGSLIKNYTITNNTEIYPKFLLPIHKDTIIIGGEFTYFNTTNRKFILRLVNKNATSGGGTTTGILSSNSIDGSVLVYPNPNAGSFTIQTQQLESSYEIYNSMGELVQQGNFESKENSLILNQKGVYFIRVSTPQGSSNQKVIIE